MSSSLLNLDNDINDKLIPDVILNIWFYDGIINQNSSIQQKLQNIILKSQNIKNGDGFDYVNEMSELRNEIKQDIIIQKPQDYIDLIKQLTNRFEFLSQKEEGKSWWHNGFIQLMQENKDFLISHTDLIDKVFAKKIFNLSLKLENNTIIKDRLIKLIIIPILECFNKIHLISDQVVKDFKTNYAINNIISR